MECGLELVGKVLKSREHGIGEEGSRTTWWFPHTHVFRLLVTHTHTSKIIVNYQLNSSITKVTHS